MCGQRRGSPSIGAKPPSRVNWPGYLTWALFFSNVSPQAGCLWHAPRAGVRRFGRLRSQTIEGDCPIRRPMRAAPEREPAGPRMNEDIRVREVRLIDETGDNVGVVPTADALARATEAGLDLVEISPDANPPVAKILDYGKYKYQEQKKAAEARKKQKIVEIKEIKMRPSIDDHDYDVKMRVDEAVLRRRRQGQGDAALPRPRAGPSGARLAGPAARQGRYRAASPRSSPSRAWKAARW